ncbi:DUF1176 domain-containing protein [Brevundimonas lenta]
MAACGDGAATEKATGAAAPASAASATAAAVAAAGVQPEVREFRDWRAVCDNGNACVAYTGSDEGGWLRVGMEAGPNARPTVVASEGFQGSDPAKMRLKIDGRDFALTGGPQDAANADASEARARGLLAALAGARSVSLELDDRSIALPASGASAALLWIDERQGRLGTTTALLRRGDRPASAVPAAPAVPVVRPAPAIAQTGFEGASNPMEDEPRGLVVPVDIEARVEVKACRAENNEYLDKAVLAARLDAATVLWGVPCGSGAYNATYVLYLARPDGTGVRPADLPTWRPQGRPGETDLWLVNPVYYPQTRTLIIFPRGRGLGDCGTITVWTWTANGFALTEERTMGDCQGMPPDQWPTTWRTRG